MSWLLGLLDYFLPAGMRTNPSDLMRGYIFIGLCASNILVCIIMLLVLFFYLDLQQNTPIGAALNLVCLGGNALALLLFKRSENLALASFVVLSIIAIVMYTGIQITGGYFESPILQMLLQLPITAFLLLGLSRGLYWLAATVIMGVVCYITAVLGVGYTQLLERPDVVEAMDFAMQLVLLGLVAGALIIYEMLNGLLNRQLHEERNRFEHKASHDDLTGVPNRFEFFRRLKLVIDDAREREHKVGVVYIDLDEFKPINDQYGHHAGDEALRLITERMQRVLRLSDTTARLGGDEFGLILPGIHVPTDIESIMPKVLAAIREPLDIDGKQMTVYGSCGVAIFPDHSQDFNALCRYADTAMYRAKERSDNYLVYKADMTVGEI